MSYCIQLYVQFVKYFYELLLRMICLKIIVYYFCSANIEPIAKTLQGINVPFFKFGAIWSLNYFEN